MNEYQKFVAAKALTSLQLMEKISLTDSGIKKLLKIMQPSFERIINGTENLPSKTLDGWWLHFSPEGSYGIFDQHRPLSETQAELSILLRHTSMESYLQYMSHLDNL